MIQRSITNTVALYTLLPFHSETNLPTVLKIRVKICKMTQEQLFFA